MKLNDLFIVKNGTALDKSRIHSQRISGGVPFLRPAKTQQRTIAGWVRPLQTDAPYVHPAETIFVSTNGEGSHTYAYLSDFAFIANTDVACLIPRRPMSRREKLFYVAAITMNRHKFSYGRKPKGQRLKSIVLPDRAPDWISMPISASIRAINLAADHIHASSCKAPPIGNDIQTTAVSQLFEISGGSKLDLNKMTPLNSGVAFVSRSGKNNGVVAHVKKLDTREPFPAGLLTVALGGSVLTTSLQVEPFYTAQNVAVLRPRQDMDVATLLFYATAIQENAFRFTACGREANRFLKNLLIPAVPPIWIRQAYSEAANSIKSHLEAKASAATAQQDLI